MQSSFLGQGLQRAQQRRCVAAAPGAGGRAASVSVVAHYGGKANLGGGKAWERTEVNANGKPVPVKMHVKAGDVVKVRA
jgi:hypothetical protein